MQEIISIIIFAVVIVAIMTEKVHRTAAALAGTAALLLLHVLTVDEAFDYVDFNTIGVLVGMMLFVGVVRQSGMFEYASVKAAKLAKGDPWRILVAFTVLTAVLSAFLDNVTTVLLVGPMSITIAQMLEIDPIPILLCQIFASNIGGTATLIGDPPNIMIGSKAGLNFMDFINNTGGICCVILAVMIVGMKFLYGKKMSASPDKIKEVMQLDEKKQIRDAALMKKALVMIVLIVVGFVLHSQLGYESSVVALTAAAVMLIIGRQDVEQVVAEVEWPTILFFIGLFIVVGGMVKTGVIKQLAMLMIEATTGHPVATMMILLWASAILSSFLDNIPFVATLIPLVIAMGSDGIDIAPLWWCISLGACLGGNGTQIGASANVVLSSIATRKGYPISFAKYTKVGFPVMLVSVAISMVYILIRYA
ncbi:MAG: ArsB/NhaD family transporter [Eubacteriales bacterium]|nr:ArsB/NhaD family transporter [Eubacteriales bacterium]